MAYARYSDSDWYIYWSTWRKYPKQQDINGETLSVGHIGRDDKAYTYAEIIGDPAIIDREWGDCPDIRTLKNAVDDWLKDVYAKDYEMLIAQEEK